jgi:hypothetical protein
MKSRHPIKCGLYPILADALAALMDEPMDAVEALALKFAAGHIETARHNHEQNDHEGSNHEHNRKNETGAHRSH